MITIANANALHIPLPDQSVQCIVTSPPYYGLRDYGTAKWEGGSAKCAHSPSDTPNRRGIAASTLGGGKEITGHQQEGYSTACKRCGARRIDAQIGLESTPAAYVASIVAVMRECKRVLRDDGCLWLNLGDSFSDKQLMGIPWKVAFALQGDGWILRQDIIWSKPNPMPESVTDRCTKAHEYVFLLTKQARYYYDAEAISEPAIYAGDDRGSRTDSRRDVPMASSMNGITGATRNRRSVWTIATSPYSGAHFATFPPALIEPMILAGTSARGECPHCGKAWVRVVERESLNPWSERKANGATNGSKERGYNENHGAGMSHDLGVSSNTIGWRKQCSCPPHEPIPQTVFDPFAGSGTTGAVAVKHGRRAVLLDLNTKYIDLQFERTNGVQITMPLETIAPNSPA